MFDSLQTQLAKMLGKREEDPQGTITAEQLKVVLKSIEGKYNALKSENKLSKATIEEQRAAIAGLERSLAEAKQVPSANDPAVVAERERLEEQLRMLGAQQSELQGQLEAARAEKMKLQSDLSVQDALVTSLRRELSEAEEARSTAADPTVLAAAQAEVETLRGAVATLKAHAEELETQLQALASDAASDQPTREALAAELATERERAEAEAGEAAALREKLATVETELAFMHETQRAEAEERAAGEEAAERLSALSDELAGERERSAAQAARNEQLEAQLARAEALLSQLEMDKDGLRTQVSKQQAELERLEGAGPGQKVLDELEERLLEAKSKQEMLAAENTALKQRLQQLLEEPASMGAREKLELELQIKRLGDEMREASVQIAALREAKVKANLDLEETAGEIVELRRQLDEMRKDRNFYRTRYEDAREAGAEAEVLKAQVRALTQEAQRLRTEQALGAQTAEPPIVTVVNPAEPPAVETGDELSRRRAMLNRMIGQRKGP